MATTDKLINLRGLDYFNKHAVAPNFETVTTLAEAMVLMQEWMTESETKINGIGDISTLNTTDKSSAVSAINEIKNTVDGLGEPFRVKQWAGSNLSVEIPCCTENIVNTSIAKMTFKISGQEATDFQVVGMIAYEIKDNSGQRVNCWPVCQFTGQNQTELSVRWMCGGTSRKTAVSINAWVLLKHR